MTANDFGDMIRKVVQANRTGRFSRSSQLSLGELILKLEAVQHKNLPVLFDDERYRPLRSLCSWRGSYNELAILYAERVLVDDDRFLITTDDLLKLLKSAVGRKFGGWKGGEYRMHRGTPVWIVYEPGGAAGFREDNNTAVVGVEERIGWVVIITASMRY